jgi:hypothetical protein
MGRRSTSSFRRGTALRVALATAGIAAAAHGGDRLEDLAESLEQSCIRGELPEIEGHLEALESYLEAEPESARGHALLGLAELRRALLTNGSVDSREAERSRACLAAAQAHLDRARRLDPGIAEVYAARVTTNSLAFQLGTSDPAGLYRESVALVQAGREVDPEHPYLRLLELQLALSGPGAAGAAERVVDETLALIEQCENRILASPAAEPGFWDLMTFGMAARKLLFLPDPRPGVAAGLTTLALDYAPDFKMARDFLRPFVTAREPLAPAEFEGLRFEPLAEDPAADGAAAGLPDAIAFEVSPDPDFLWVRLPLAAPVPDSRFGINLVVAAEGPGGAAWWGENPVPFDRLVTVWVARDDTGRYRGAVGIAGPDAAYAGEMCSNLDGAVSFALEPGRRAFVLRVPWDALDADGAVRLCAAVGSNAQWNDDVPGAGTVEVLRGGSEPGSFMSPSRE